MVEEWAAAAAMAVVWVAEVDKALLAVAVVATGAEDSVPEASVFAPAVAKKCLIREAKNART